jgi:tRNA threonylcarbamoyladenosine biosynthesis protein TsaE
MQNFKYNYNLSEINKIAEKIINFNKKIILFYGDIGAGKTTLIKEICKQLNSKSNFSSPTYQIVNEYSCPNALIYHFDLYRIKTKMELIDLGFDDYLFSENYCLIEWPELAEGFVTENYIKLKIITIDNGREVEIEVY